MIKQSVYIDKITADLPALADFVKNKNAMSLSSDATLVEDIFKGVLNIVYGYSLRNLNEGGKDYPIIDLGDDGGRICVQVTSETNRDKIQNTVKDFAGSEDRKKYDTLLIFIVGYKKTYKPFDDHGITFNKNDNVLDVRTILKQIRYLEIKELIRLSEYLDSVMDTRVVINPVELSEEDIRSILETLWSHFGGVESSNHSGKKYIIESRGENFISRKNDVNKVDEGLFSGAIKPNLKYADLIERFLGDPINSEYQKKYFEITDSIQQYLKGLNQQECSIEQVFEKVFDDVINYKNRDFIDEYKLLIVLHNMYFNCDIGNNPSV